MADDPSASLPQVDLLPGSVLTVTVDVAGAKVTQLNVHGFQEEPDTATPNASPVSGAYVYGGELA